MLELDCYGIVQKQRFLGNTTCVLLEIITYCLAYKQDRDNLV